MLILILLLRFYYIVRLLIVVTKFYGDRADRVTKMMGSRLSMFFSLKCLICKYPYEMISVSTIVISFSLAKMIQVVEAPLYYLTTEPGKSNYNDYRSFGNCVWNMFVTMTTGKLNEIIWLCLVGYGDYYPLTMLGRFIIMITSVAGIISVSFIIIFLQSSTNLSENEGKVKWI